MRSVLLVKTSSLGDVIHNLPVASDLLRHWPQLAIDWVVEENFAEVPRLHPGVRDVIPVAIRRWRKQLGRGETWREIAAFRRRLRANCYDLVIDTQGLTKSALITRLADGLRCGFDAASAREPLAARFYDCRYAIPRNAHAVERNRWLAAAAAGYAPDLPLRYGLHPSMQAAANTCILLTATSRDDKLWPETHWQALGQRLAARGLTCLLPAGSARERERAARIATGIPGASLAPPSSLGELASLMAAARGVVGVDTGLTHLAAALDRPVVALYVATDPGLTGVHAGARALNLGGKGQCPSPDDVFGTLAPQLDGLVAP
ncbi:MAG: lipopolysaccharide heptosyltransferase I [Candidatus Dactylopiibacterium sp.]|nr:lipopolysaccharide heptosyltransferase I [Candidatus Dactylopiibacterium sp.]